MSQEMIIAFLTLSAMEIVLGIDNIVFITILCGKLPEKQRALGRNIGLGLALALRIGLLFSVKWIMGLTEPLIHVLEKGFSGRDLILLGGGLFLMAKATFEIHHKLEETQDPEVVSGAKKVKAQFASILFQILILDLVFSLDSVITAVGMVSDVGIMIGAMTLAMVVMMLSAKSIGSFVEKHPTVKMLALSFLILIGFMLMLEGVGKHIDKGYIYFAMAFSLGVELLNMKFRAAKKIKH